MMKQYCDRCKNEIDPIDKVYRYEIKSPQPFIIELDSICNYELGKWITRGRNNAKDRTRPGWRDIPMASNDTEVVSNNSIES